VSRYRAGPWPGLTPRGAGILLACAAFLAIGQIMVGPPAKPLPDLAVVGATALFPMLVGLRIVRTLGAGSAVCGVYLLPASTVSLLLPGVAPPPLLLVPAIVLDLALWLEPADLKSVADLLPGVHLRRRVPVRAWQPTTARVAMAGAAFGLVLSLVEPPFRILLGADPAVWSGPPLWVGVVATTAVCAAIATLLTARGTAA
jgi:hypothetical protein